MARAYCAVPYRSLDALVSTNHLALPRLPIPALDDTLDRYLQSAAAVCDGDALSKQQALVAALRKGSGPELQRSLVARDTAAAESGQAPFYYFENYWDDMYLSARCPNTVHISPFYLFSPSPDGDDSPASRAARYVHSAAVWLWKSRSGGIIPDGGDLSQVGRFFGTARIPGEQTDTLQFRVTADTSRCNVGDGSSASR